MLADPSTTWDFAQDYDLDIDVDGLDLGPLTVTAMRDSAALPETGASSADDSGRASCSCCYVT
ncbi:thiopeptide-type bacteriocin [Solwaraspora sp. WMMB335]|uniref:thiopeptide-type bacteriocin n=1 Tax=Solwaraspora sp. WMMB335 TaxID=3404118 RepID=UPI003B93BA47